MRTPLWQIKIQFPDGDEVVRRIRSEELCIGSTYGAQVHLPEPFPDKFLVASANKDGKRVVEHGKNKKTLKSGDTFRSEWKGCKFELSEVELEPFHFHPHLLNLSSKGDLKNYVLWHYLGDNLLESENVTSGEEFRKLPSGLRVQWDSLTRNLLVKGTEESQYTLKLESQGDVLYAFHENHCFLITPKGSEEVYHFQPQHYHPEKDNFRKYFLGFIATWILLFFVGNIAFTDTEDPLEEDIVAEVLPEDVDKVKVEKESKPGQGGNGRRGGGGIVAESSDARGGAGVDTVVVKNLANLGSGSSVLDALSSIDSSVQRNNKKAAVAGIAPTKGLSATGLLNALGKINKGGSKGVGVGGVGTKGFGGGGGGGSGKGFGSGIGDGLGKGKGPRRLVFAEGDSSVRGGLEKSEVAAVVKQNIAQIRFCYNRGLRSRPEMQGRVESNWVIAPNGKVKKSRIRESSLAAPDVENCIKNKIALWNFPKPRGGKEVTVNYPFSLRSQ